MNICVVGQGYVGLPISIYAARAGYTVYGYDTNKEKIAELEKGNIFSPEVDSEEFLELLSNKKINLISELSTNISISLFIIAVPTPLNEIHEPDISMLKKACKSIAQVITPNSLVINESTSFIGTLRGFIKPLIDKESKAIGLKYAVAPERIDPGNTIWTVSSTPRIISGLSADAINEAVHFYKSFCSIIHTVAQPEIAEAAKLIENTFRQVNIALMNELSEVADKYSFSLHDAINAASTKPFGFMPFYPSIGVGGHCIPVDPSYLVYSADKVGISTPLINLANSINLNMPETIITRIETYIGSKLSGKTIQIVGISYKADVADTRESPAIQLIKILRSKGAIVSWCDPVVEKYNEEISSPLTPNIDLGLVITPHTSIDLSVWKEAKTKVLDLSANSNNYGWDKFL